MIYAWDEINRDHVGKHDATPAEAQFVVENATPPFPQDLGDEKWRVWGATLDGRLLQVIYVLKDQDDVAFESVDPVDWATLQGNADAKIARIIYAMDMTSDMKRHLRRRRR